MEKITFNLKNWISKNRTEFVILLVILLVGAFLRLFKIDQYMTFLGDEGRDVIIVRNLLVHADPILIGPGTSVGGMYLGPLYYYFMAPFLLLANFSPVGPAMGVALLAVFTIYMVYKVGKDWFDNTVGLVAASLYSFSATVIIFSRSSWNPNIMPFFALLSIYSVRKAQLEKKYNWLILSAISFAFVLQSHYLGLIILPVILICWVYGYLDSRAEKDKLQKIKFIKASLLSLGVFIFLMSPLVLFDLRHDFLNSKALYKFLTVREETVSIKPWTAIPKSYPIFEQINTSLLAANNYLIGKYISIFMLLMVLWFLFKKQITIKPLNNLTIIIIWFAFALIGFGIYKQRIYDHYFGFLFPVPFLIFGVIYKKLLQTKLKFFVVGVFMLLLGNLIVNSPIKNQPNNQLKRAAEVAKKIEKEAKGQRFNLGVIAERNYEDGYKYFLLHGNQPIVSIDSQEPNSITDQLFAICELEKVKCDPTHNSSAAVANFGWSKIAVQCEVDGLQVYKLVHTQK